MDKKWITKKDDNGNVKHIPIEQRKEEFQMAKEPHANPKELEAIARNALKELADMPMSKAVMTDLKQYAGLIGYYSPYNAILIKSYDPDATRVMSKYDWERLGYKLRANAKPIPILVPYGIPKRPSDPEIAAKIEKMREEGQSEEFINSKINELIEKKSTRYHTRVFGTSNVYDAKSVDGKVPPEEHLKNSEIYEILKAGVAKHFPVEEGSIDTARGLTIHTSDEDRKIKVMKVPNESAESINTLAHEAGHAVLKHDYRKMPRWQAEAEAELTSYIVAAHYGVDTTDIALAYVKHWLGNNKLGEESIDKAMKAAGQIIQWADQANVERMLKKEQAKEDAKRIQGAVDVLKGNMELAWSSPANDAKTIESALKQEGIKYHDVKEGNTVHYYVEKDKAGKAKDMLEEVLNG